MRGQDTIQVAEAREFRGLPRWLTAIVIGALSSAALAQTTAPAPIASDYAKRAVAYINENELVSRQQLGEYLVERQGAEKIELLVNRRIIEAACRTHGLEVTAAEIENALADDLKGLNVDRARFIREILKAYRKNLYEWKEDILRPKLLLAKLCQDRIQVTNEEIDELFDATYGEKIDCRIILWPKGQEENAKAEYSALRDSEDAFAVKAKNQQRGNLAATGGKIKPIARGTLGLPEAEREAFTLKPGEVSRLLTTPEGIILLKCDRRLPADATVNRDKVRGELVKQVKARKVHLEIPKVFAELRKNANPKTQLPAPGSAENTAVSREPSAVVAILNGADNVTREELGEFLIARYGAEKLELLVNKLILERACQARQVSCGPVEVEAELQKDLQRLNVDRKNFADSVLKKQRLTLYEWTEDVLKPKVLLGKLCREKVTVAEEDLKKAFDAYYGEKINCRLILWPKGEERVAMLEYAKISKSEEEFSRKARTQSSPSLAAKGGGVGALGRHTTGNEELEREAFTLEPGEMSRLIGTPEGTVVIKCDTRQPANASITIDSVRTELMKEVMERKVQAEMPRLFAELRTAAKPRFLLKDSGKAEDLASEVAPEIQNLDLKNVPALKLKGN